MNTGLSCCCSDECFSQCLKDNFKSTVPNFLTVVTFILFVMLNSLTDRRYVKVLWYSLDIYSDSPQRIDISDNPISDYCCSSQSATDNVDGQHTVNEGPFVVIH